MDDIGSSLRNEILNANVSMFSTHNVQPSALKNSFVPVDLGECEQFHSEIKTDMDVERLPSGKFETNELVLELTVLAYNILRLIGQESFYN